MSAPTLTKPVTTPSIIFTECYYTSQTTVELKELGGTDQHFQIMTEVMISISPDNIRVMITDDGSAVLTPVQGK